MKPPAARPSSTGDVDSSRSATAAASTSAPSIAKRRALPDRLAMITPSVGRYVDMLGGYGRAPTRPNPLDT
jgi:hypothetical protein